MSMDTSNADQLQERRILWQVLLLNAALSAGLAVAGVLGDSSGLLANALDNASDAVVYVVCLLAVGRSRRLKRLAALASGVLLLVFAAGILLDAVRRALTGSEPVGLAMVGMSVAASGVNLLCLWLLKPIKTRDVNLRAAQTFSVNDFVSNLGILVAGGLVAWTGRAWPDLVVGIAVAAVATKGAFEIIGDARRTAPDADTSETPPEPAAERTGEPGHAGRPDRKQS
mgnify:CR=1 FL=1